MVERAYAYCIRDHEMTPENTITHVTKADGVTRRCCRKCKNAARSGYKRQKRLEKLPVDRDAPERFAKALEEATRNPNAPQPKCATPVGEVSPWIDWATEEEDREPYEGAAPDRAVALSLCSDCPLYNICTDAALAKPPFHGVLGAGLIFENGKRLR